MVEIVDEVRKEFVKDLVASGKRPSGRGFDDYREISIERNVIPNAEGSARVHLGKSQVLVAVKLAIGTPFADKPNEGVLATSAELLPLASPLFESGPPDANSIELARVVDRGIRSSETIDLASLKLADNKVWNVFVDIYVLDHDGNLIDAAAVAAMAALQCARMPKMEGDAIKWGEYAGPLPVKETCVCATFGKIGSAILADPDLDEEKALDARLTIATTPGRICAMQKGGRGGFTRDEVVALMDRALAKGDAIRAKL